MKPKERERYLTDEEILKLLDELDNESGSEESANESDSELDSGSFSESEPNIPLAKSVSWNFSKFEYF